MFNGQSIIDLSHPITPELMPYPGDPPLVIKQLADVDSQGYWLNHISGTAHIGTHIDAPSHFFKDGKTVDHYPVHHWLGQAMVIDAFGRSIITAENTDIPDLTDVNFLLFHTGWDRWMHTSKYIFDHPVIDPTLTEKLATSEIRGIGMDGPSPDKEPYPVHRALLGADMILIENMTQLGNLPVNQRFSFMVVPLRLSTEASWVRPLAFLPSPI